MDNKKNNLPLATMEMANGAKVVWELYPEHAPKACESFTKLANSGRYDNQPITRIVPGFVIQPSYNYFDQEDLNFDIEGEFAAAGYKNGLPNDKYSVALAGNGKTLSSGSEFFFTLEYDKRLDGRFTTFGKVISGWEEIERLTNVELIPVPCDEPEVIINRPAQEQIISSIRVEN